MTIVPARAVKGLRTPHPFIFFFTRAYSSYNMKTLIFLVSGIIFLAGCQKPSKEVFATHVVGTPVRVPLPAGFYADPSITGFRHNVYTQATIQVVSVPLRYEQAVPELDNMEAVGQKLVAKEPVAVDGVNGILCDVRFAVDGFNYRQWRLVLPEGINTVTVSGTFPVDQEKDISAPVRKALLAVKLDGKPDATVFAFQVRPAGGLKMAKIFEGPSVMYTGDGSWTNASIFSYSLLCGSTMAGPVSEPTDYAMQSFRQICSTCVIEGQDSLQVDGLNVREIWGLREDSVATRLKYEAIFFDSTVCFYLIGTTDEKHRDRLESFRATARNWHRKEKRA